MHILRVAALAGFAGVAACAPRPEMVHFDAPWKADEVAWSTNEGGNTVSGFAVLRTVSGEARTCAGLSVELIPESRYSELRLYAIWGYMEKNYKSANELMRRRLDNADPGYLATIRRTRCDGQGNFSFDKIPDGSWYVVAAVVWKADPRSPLLEGGSFIQHIKLQGNRGAKVTMP
jgi:hypothetical protein